MEEGKSDTNSEVEIIFKPALDFSFQEIAHFEQILDSDHHLPNPLVWKANSEQGKCKDTENKTQNKEKKKKVEV